MRKQFILTALSCLFLVQAFPQAARIRGTVKGVIADTSGHQSMSEATVSITPDRDTTDAQFVITDKKGTFLFKGVESADRYLLAIRWASVEAHNVDFRGSPAFQEWRSIVGPFFASPPAVEHFETLSSSD